MQRLPALAAIGGAMIWLGSTGCVTSARHALVQRLHVTQTERLEVLRNQQHNAERDLRRAVRARTVLLGQTKRQRQALRQVRGRLLVAKHQQATCRRRVLSLQAPGRLPIRPTEHVVFQETIIWGGHVSPTLAQLFQSTRRRLAGCYAAHVTASDKAAVAVIRIAYRVTARGIRAVTLHPTTRAGRPLRHCVAQVIRTQALPRPKRSWRVSQSLAFAPRRQQAARAPYTAHRFPWRLHRRHRAGPGRICSLGSRHRRRLKPAERLNPFYVRPCALGLQCCSSSGVPGSDSVCKRKCGPKMP